VRIKRPLHKKPNGGVLFSGTNATHLTKDGRVKNVVSMVRANNWSTNGRLVDGNGEDPDTVLWDRLPDLISVICGEEGLQGEARRQAAYAKNERRNDQGD